MATPQPSYTVLNKNDSNACESADPPPRKAENPVEFTAVQLQ